MAFPFIGRAVRARLAKQRRGTVGDAQSPDAGHAGVGNTTATTGIERHLGDLPPGLWRASLTVRRPTEAVARPSTMGGAANKT